MWSELKIKEVARTLQEGENLAHSIFKSINDPTELLESIIVLPEHHTEFDHEHIGAFITERSFKTAVYRTLHAADRLYEATRIHMAAVPDSKQEH